MLEYKGYIGQAEYDAEAHVFHGEVLNTRDVITFQGDSVRNFERAFRESIDDYLEFSRVSPKNEVETPQVIDSRGV